jgi:cyclopropane-fatty-acyl-phospholipid synthase
METQQSIGKSVGKGVVSQRQGFGLKSAARNLVFKQLQALHTGQLVIRDNGEEFVFGDSSDTGIRAELHVKDAACYVDILTGGSIGAAESFMTNDWETPDLTMLIRLMVRNMDILDGMEGGLARLSKPLLRILHRMNQNTVKGSKRNIAAHYDLGNEFFARFLDPSMMYSSAIFPSEDSSLEEAQRYRLDVICKKLQLNESDHVVEIGTGWGGFAVYAAKNYGCKVTTTTISKEQYALAKKRVEEEGLQDRVTLLLEDYRKLDGQFDKLVSIEMIEAVGWKYYPTYYETCARLLKPEGLMLIQAITITDQRYERAKRDVDFIQRYIFPGSCIPSISALTEAMRDNSDLRMVEQYDFAEHYARTLAAWNDRCKRYEKEIDEMGYSETFRRMWEFYLCYCEGGFAERSIGVSHLIYAKPDFRSEKVLSL